MRSLFGIGAYGVPTRYREGGLTVSNNGLLSYKPTQHPKWSYQKVDGIPEKGRLISFDRVSYKLQYPANDEQQQRPAPVEKEQRQGEDNHRYPDAVREPVQRVLMLRFVIS